MTPDLTVSDDLRSKVRALGDAGAAWLEGLPQLVRELAEEWEVTVGATIGCGSSGIVLATHDAGGIPRALKLSMPDGLRGNTTFVSEVAALRAGEGSFVAVHRVDPDRRALLLDRLGRPLEALDLTIEEQLDVLAVALARTWRPLAQDAPFPSGHVKAAALAEWIEQLWEELGRPCRSATIDHVRALCDDRRRAIEALEPDGLVLVHGDGHPANCLERAPGDRSGFTLIDPEGLRSEPAHDLGIPVRDWNVEALASPDPARTVQRWCRRLGASTGVDADAVLAWATIERVSTGLFVLQLGIEAGRDFLAVADLLASA